MPIAWSRIQSTELASEARGRIELNEIYGCAYHNLDHVLSMYQYLADTNEPYDEALDWAVLFHDIVYDAEPEKEWRSAKMFFDMNQQYPTVSDKEVLWNIESNIVATIDHSIRLTANEFERAIIRADLHALTDKVQTTRNFVKIMDESMNLYGCTVEEFAEKNILFMEGLTDRMLLNLLAVDTNEEVFYKSIIEGIGTTIRLAQAMKG